MAASMADYQAEREAMVERHLKRRGITEQHIIDAFLAVPREEFVSPQYAHLAYGDHPLPIEARADDLAAVHRRADDPGGGDKSSDLVLEVGAGSGYAAAVISRIAGKVIGIERQHDLVELGRQRLERLGYECGILEGDGTRGFPEHAPFDAILAAASGSHVPQPWIEQLATAGGSSCLSARPSGRRS